MDHFLLHYFYVRHKLQAIYKDTSLCDMNIYEYDSLQAIWNPGY